jgi:hypothetical protein
VTLCFSGVRAAVTLALEGKVLCRIGVGSGRKILLF